MLLHVGTQAGRALMLQPVVFQPQWPCCTQKEIKINLPFDMLILTIFLRPPFTHSTVESGKGEMIEVTRLLTKAGALFKGLFVMPRSSPGWGGVAAYRGRGILFCITFCQCVGVPWVHIVIQRLRRGLIFDDHIFLKEAGSQK